MAHDFLPTVLVHLSSCEQRKIAALLSAYALHLLFRWAIAGIAGALKLGSVVLSLYLCMRAAHSVPIYALRRHLGSGPLSATLAA